MATWVAYCICLWSGSKNDEMRWSTTSKRLPFSVKNDNDQNMLRHQQSTKTRDINRGWCPLFLLVRPFSWLRLLDCNGFLCCIRLIALMSSTAPIAVKFGRGGNSCIQYHVREYRRLCTACTTVLA